jgi:membrane-bound serine protease (ClpP class)
LSACALKNQLDLSPHGADAAVGEIAVQEAPCINWAGAALLILALTLFLLEAKIASHGILGTGGTVAMVLGAVLLINGPPELRIHLTTALAVSVPFALITIFLMTLIVRSRTARIAVGQPALINVIAHARTALAPVGTVR